MTTTDVQKAYVKTYNARLYAKRKDAGICVKCGKAPPVDGLVRCEVCRKRNRRDVEAWTRQKKKREAAAVSPPEEPQAETPKHWSDYYDYDPASPTAAECAVAIQEACDLHDAKHSKCPTPAEITERVAEVQAGWTAKDEQNRAGSGATVPAQVATAGSYREVVFGRGRSSRIGKRRTGE